MGNSLPEIYREEIYETEETFKVKYGISGMPASWIRTQSEDYDTVRELVENIKSQFDSTNPIPFENMKGIKFNALRIHDSKNVVFTIKRGLLDHEVQELSCRLTE